MAGKKKTPQPEGSESTPKALGLFDHVRHIREVQDPKYFDTLSDADLKSWNNYIICRFLSMDSRYIDLINEIQKYSTLPPKEFYQLCITVTPRGRSFVPYIKSKADSKYPKEIMELLCLFFQDGEDVVESYLQLMTDSDVMSIVAKYGIGETEYNKIIKKK